MPPTVVAPPVGDEGAMTAAVPEARAAPRLPSVPSEAVAVALPGARARSPPMRRSIDRLRSLP